MSDSPESAAREATGAKMKSSDYQALVINGVACPVCQARVGEHCKMTKGRPYQIGGERIPHHARYQLFHEGRDIIPRQLHEQVNR